MANVVMYQEKMKGDMHGGFGNVLMHQAKFLNSRKKHTAIVGGYGSGKTIAGLLKAMWFMQENPGSHVAYYLPTINLAKSVVYPKLDQLFSYHGWKYSVNRTDHKFNTKYGRIDCKSMEDPSKIVAYEHGYSIIDEADEVKSDKMGDVFMRIMGRTRAPVNYKVNPIDFVSTPGGHGFLYDFFVMKSDDEKKLMINASSFDNPFNPEDWASSLKQEYTEKQSQAFIEGRFVNLTDGLVYEYFDRDLNFTDREVRPFDNLHIGVDFNFGRMASVVCIYEHGLMKVVDEFYGDTNTETLCKSIKERFPNHQNQIRIYPDSTGGRNTSNSNQSDIDILKSHFRGNVFVNRNPSVRDRVNKVNALFCNSVGDRKCFVNINKCKHLARCLEFQVYDDKGRPDKTKEQDHLPDALGYCLMRFRFQKGSKYKFSAV